MVQRVSFHDGVLVHIDSSHSLQDRKPMFYSIDEMIGFEEEIVMSSRVCKSMRISEVESKANVCVRGLEDYFDEDRMIKKRKQRVLASLAVFLEQDRQFLEEGLFTPADSHTLAHRYRQITRQSAEAAHKTALIYEQSERSYYPIAPESGASSYPVKKSASFPKTRQVCSLPRRRRVSLGPSAA